MDAEGFLLKLSGPEIMDTPKIPNAEKFCGFCSKTLLYKSVLRRTCEQLTKPRYRRLFKTFRDTVSDKQWYVVRIIAFNGRENFKCDEAEYLRLLMRLFHFGIQSPQISEAEHDIVVTTHNSNRYFSCEKLAWIFSRSESSIWQTVNGKP